MCPASPYIDAGLVKDVATRSQSSGGRLRQIVETDGAFRILLEKDSKYTLLENKLTLKNGFVMDIVT